MASIGIIRNTKEVIDATPIVDGQILITIDEGDDNKIYMDYGSQRITIGSNGRPIDEVLNAESDNPIANKAVAGVMLQTMEQIQAVTKSGFLADAKAIKELVEFGSGVEISWEDYQALSDEERNSGILYFIKDYQSGLYTAGREVTKAEYDALTKEQQNNGTLWLITDDSSGIPAQGVEYDNRKSGTESATVQGALDEICTHLKQDVNVRLTQVQNQIIPTASIESGETASKAYSVDEYLVKNGVLYKVTNAIAKDDALTVGTNIVMTTVGSELSSMKSSLTDRVQLSLDAVAVGKDEDGDTIYEKTFKGSTISSGTVVDSNLTVSNLKWIHLVGGCFNDDNAIIRMLPYDVSVINAGSRHEFQIFSNTKGLVVEYMDVSVKMYHFTVQYVLK